LNEPPKDTLQTLLGPQVPPPEGRVHPTEESRRLKQLKALSSQGILSDPRAELVDPGEIPPDSQINEQRSRRIGDEAARRFATETPALQSSISTEVNANISRQTDSTASGSRQEWTLRLGAVVNLNLRGTLLVDKSHILGGVVKFAIKAVIAKMRSFFTA
jgi:hypothetical protein